MHKYDYVLWDWNGTLVDDLDANMSVINSLLRKRGLPMLTKEKYRSIFKFPIIGFYREAGFDVNGPAYETLVVDYQEDYTQQMHRIQLMPNAEYVLNLIHQTDTKQVIFSASTRKAILDQMEHYNISNLFDSIISLTDAYAYGKLELAKHWLDISGANPNRVLIVGDTLHDYEIAKEMKFDCLLIANGHQDLRKSQTQYTCKCLSDIVEVLDYL